MNAVSAPIDVGFNCCQRVYDEFDFGQVRFSATG